jgi:hypothetical protein
MTILELQRALRQLRCSVMTARLETRQLEAETDRPDGRIATSAALR